MFYLIIQVFVIVSSLLKAGLCTENVASVENPTSKDMYVVRATVYQVGILTNRTNETTDSNAGRQEAVTIYHNNGSSIDLGALPSPLLTNVTAEKMVGVAPVNNESTPWTALQHLISAPRLLGNSSTSKDLNIKVGKSKREVSKTPVEIIKGAAIIPSEAGVNSIALPPLLTLNKNLSKIPVPIPNTSVVSYAKVNTLVQSP